MQKNSKLSPKGFLVQAILVVAIAVVFAFALRLRMQSLQSEQRAYTTPVATVIEIPLGRPNSQLVAPLVRAATVLRHHLRRWTYKNRSIMCVVLSPRPYSVGINQQLLKALPKHCPFPLRVGKMTFHWNTHLLRRAYPGETTMTFFDEPVLVSNPCNGYIVSICLSGVTFLNSLNYSTTNYEPPVFQRYSFLKA